MLLFSIVMLLKIKVGYHNVPELISVSFRPFLDVKLNGAFILSRPPFTAFNQKELAEKIREGKFRRIPYRYSDQLNDLLTKMLNLKVTVASQKYEG